MIRDKLLLDVGGTFIKCSDGRTIPIDSDGTNDEIASALRSAVFGEGEPSKAGIRVAIPGPFDYKNGVFLMKHKFSAVYGESFTRLAGFNGKACFIHDVNCMLLGEVASGAGKGYKRAALIALGTGLGFSMYVDGKVLTNETGSPLVSIWKLPYRDGILEDYVSKRGIVGRYGDPAISVKEIARRAFSGDEKAKAVFAETGDMIGENVAPILKEYRISILLLGGQISRSAELFLPALKARLGKAISVLPVSDIDNATFNGLRALG